MHDDRPHADCICRVLDTTDVWRYTDGCVGTDDVGVRVIDFRLFGLYSHRAREGFDLTTVSFSALREQCEHLDNIDVVAQLSDDLVPL